jgi:hypothetical protein
MAHVYQSFSAYCIQHARYDTSYGNSEIFVAFCEQNTGI